MQYNNIFLVRERGFYSLSLSLSFHWTRLNKCLMSVLPIEQSLIVKDMCLQCLSVQSEMFRGRIFSTGKRVIVGFIQSATWTEPTVNNMAPK